MATQKILANDAKRHKIPVNVNGVKVNKLQVKKNCFQKAEQIAETAKQRHGDFPRTTSNYPNIAFSCKQHQKGFTHEFQVQVNCELSTLLFVELLLFTPLAKSVTIPCDRTWWNESWPQTWRTNKMTLPHNATTSKNNKATPTSIRASNLVLAGSNGFLKKSKLVKLQDSSEWMRRNQQGTYRWLAMNDLPTVNGQFAVSHAARHTNSVPLIQRNRRRAPGTQARDEETLCLPHDHLRCVNHHGAVSEDAGKWLSLFPGTMDVFLKLLTPQPPTTRQQPRWNRSSVSWLHFTSTRREKYMRYRFPARHCSLAFSPSYNAQIQALLCAFFLYCHEVLVKHGLLQKNKRCSKKTCTWSSPVLDRGRT